MRKTLKAFLFAFFIILALPNPATAQVSFWFGVGYGTGSYYPGYTPIFGTYTGSIGMGSFYNMPWYGGLGFYGNFWQPTNYPMPSYAEYMGARQALEYQLAIRLMSPQNPGQAPQIIPDLSGELNEKIATILRNTDDTEFSKSLLEKESPRVIENPNSTFIPQIKPAPKLEEKSDDESVITRYY